MSLPIKTTLTDGDSYVDIPVYKNVPVYCARDPLFAKELDHYERTPLRWMKRVIRPDGTDDFVPKQG